MGLDRKQKMMIAVLLAGALLVVLNATLLSPALPHIMNDTGVDAVTVQWLTSAYSLVEAVIIPLNAFLLGRFSTRKLFIGGMAWFSVAAVVAALAPNFYVILLGRIMMAMATGIVMPMVFTLILLIFPREQRGSAMGTIGLIISFAPAIGPSLSGVLVDSVGWRMLFVVVAVLGVAVVVFSSLSLKNFDGFERVPFDLPSVVLLLVGMVSLLYGISSATSAETIALPFGLIAVGLVLLAIFVRRQTKLEIPVLRIEVLKSRPFRTAVILIALLQASLIGSEVVLPLYVQQVMGQPATVSGLLMLPGAVIGAICGLIAGRLFDRYGVRKVVVFGALVVAIGAFGVTQFNMDMSIVMVTVVYTTLSIGIQFLTTPINTWGINSLDNKLIQHGNSLLSTTDQIGISVGTAFIVSLTALSGMFAPAGADPVVVTYTGVHIAFIGMGCMLALVVLGVLLFVRNKNERRDGSEQQTVVTPEQVPGVGRPFVVSDVMDPRPGYVMSGSTIRDAIKLMRERNTSGIPIVDDDKRVVGFISDGDILNYLSNKDVMYRDGTNFYAVVDQDDFWARLKDLLDFDVLRLATRKVIAIDSQENVEEAFRVLSEKRIKKVPVVENGSLVGTLSRSNIIMSLEIAEEYIAQAS